MSDVFSTDRAWLWMAAALYLCGFLAGTVMLARRRRFSNQLTFFIMAAGFVVQTVGLYVRGQAEGGCPIGNSFEILQFVTWSATALYLFIGAAFRLSLLGYFMAALAAAVGIVSLAAPALDAARRVRPPGGNPWIEFHAALALFSYGVLALLALTSLMYLLQWFSVKRRQMDGLYSFLPSMQDLGQINHRLHLAGVLLLAASLAVGCGYWLRGAGGINAAMLFLGALWVLYAVALALRLANVLVERRLAWTCVVLFAIALLTIGAVSKHRPSPAPEFPAAPSKS